MIDRILENWLDNASERSYQLPFCYLLMQQNKTVLHLTRHNAMEHGKDIIAVDEQGQLYVYQLKGVKGGKLKLSQWQTMIGQLTQMAVTPVMHPSANSDKHHLSYLVLNGEIEEEVASAIHAFNQDWRSKGFPQYSINTIVRGQILQWASAVKDQFIPSEFKDFKSLLEFFLDDGKGLLDKAKFTSLLHSIFISAPEGAAAQKRLISSGALLCSLGLSAYDESENHVAIIEGWMVYIAEVFRFATRNHLASIFFQNEIDIANAIIEDAMGELLEEARPMRDLFVGSPLEDVFVFRHRTTIILGLLSDYGLRLSRKDTNHPKIADIQTVIQKHQIDIALWGEAAIPYAVAIYWFWKKINQATKGIELLKIALYMFFEVPKRPDFVFTNYYLSAEDSVLLMNDANTQLEDIRQAVDTSHVAETIVHLLAINDQKETLQTTWAEICEFVYRDFRLVRDEDLFAWRSEEGTEVTRHQPPTVKWDDLVASANMTESDQIPRLLRDNIRFIALFMMVYPHRFGRNLSVWLEHQLFN
jgi:hypothetical protein